MTSGRWCRQERSCAPAGVSLVVRPRERGFPARCSSDLSSAGFPHVAGDLVEIQHGRQVVPVGLAHFAQESIACSCISARDSGEEPSRAAQSGLAR